ncbi:hypothetical protein [Nocardia testacea]|uniref:hypothetical protein n=1 Tax=Nocardia testacea TaxID=248551 RepID=UPI003A879788
MITTSFSVVLGEIRKPSSYIVSKLFGSVIEFEALVRLGSVPAVAVGIQSVSAVQGVERGAVCRYGRDAVWR